MLLVLVKKRVKNLNLRLDRTGEVVLSVPLRCPAERADAFVIEKSGWIVGHLPKPEEAPPLPLAAVLVAAVVAVTLALILKFRRRAKRSA